MAKLTVDRVNVTEQVIEYLRENIRNGVWRPGDKIASEHELAGVLSVSRASVRHAIQQLVAIGVLISHQGKGTFVRSMPVEFINENFDHLYVNAEIIQLMEFRQMIEVESCRLAAERITENGMKKLDYFYTCMKAAPKFSREFIQNDMEFHMEVLRATKNSMIIRSMDHVIKEVEKQQQLYNTESGVRRAIRYHGEILESLKARDGKRAAAAMENHLSEVYFSK